MSCSDLSYLWCPFTEDLFSVHTVFLPKLKADLEAFVDGWNNHPLKTEGNRTPEQMWHMGMMSLQIDQPENLEVLFLFLTPFTDVVYPLEMDQELQIGEDL